MTASPAHVATWLIAALAILGVIVRPGKFPEALWALLGAAALVVGSLLSLSEAGRAVRQGLDVYLFLIGMMLLAELAREEGLFDWLATQAVRRSHGSAARLFALVYGVGILVTVFLSNDATAVVLTPAVYAAARQARAPPLPYLFICAFIANAASFVLPISNPANLVVYGAHLPPLAAWLREFGVPSLASILMTYGVLRSTQRTELKAPIARDQTEHGLKLGGRVAAAGVALTALVLLVASSREWALGLPTCLAGLATATAIFLVKRTSPWPVIRGVSWSVLPLVAGLFVLVAGVENTGILPPLIGFLRSGLDASPSLAVLVAGGTAAVGCNLTNNLPLGLLAGAIAQAGHFAPSLTGALLIGVDLGPNLSVTGSLATILWLVALRREGQAVSGWKFLRVGSLVMPPALIAALVSFVWLAH
jgi:arsenical pump membrane protein